MRERKTPNKFIIATGIFLLSACNDGPMSPRESARPEAAGSIVSVATVGDTSITVVAVNTWANQTLNVDFGNHKLVFPANSICSLGTSSYGPGEWDKPCTPEIGTVTLTVRSWSDAGGHPRIDVQPHMRFNPAASAVMLTLRDRAGTVSDKAIGYCPDLGECYDESLSDASLVTYRDSNGNYKRRVKHFSGYNIVSGRSVEAEMSMME
jgi:hypothetical protein